MCNTPKIYGCCPLNYNCSKPLTQECYSCLDKLSSEGDDIISTKPTEERLHRQKPEIWRKKRCLVCGEEFIYHIKFEHDTCDKFSCVYAFAHNKEKYLKPS